MTKTVQILLFLIYIISGLLCILAYDLNKTSKELELLKKDTLRLRGSDCGDANNGSVCEAVTSKKSSQKELSIRNPRSLGRGGSQCSSFN